MSDENKQSPHIEYRLIAEKSYELDHVEDAHHFDHVEGIIHGKEDADRLVKFLQESGYKVKLARASKTYLIDEKFAHEEEDPEA